MPRFDLRRDGLVLASLLVMLVLLAAGLTGAYRVFGFAFVALFGLLIGPALVRRGDPVTWIPLVLAITALVIAFAGMFAYEAAVVRDAGDTVLGFQRGTAFLVYGLWIPAFFTMAVGFSFVFNRLEPDETARRRSGGAR